jgi:adenine phosphoribosyltransferase
MTANEVIAAIRNVPDFPIPGIQFKDITTALNKPECLKWMRDEIVNRSKNLGITQVVGIESRGFILAPAIAIELGAGFVPIRKHNKLPAETMSVTYKKEYGEDTIQMHKDALGPADVVLIHDDILATGGSMAAAIELVKKAGVKKIYVSCIIELNGLNGRNYLEGKAENVDCVLSIDVDE